MTNPDLIYMMHEHRYQKLLAEAERVRAQRAVANGQATRSGGWPPNLATRLGRASTARRRCDSIGQLW